MAFDPGGGRGGRSGAGRSVQGGVAAQPGGHGDVGGQVLEWCADVGGVADQVDGAVAQVAGDLVEQSAGRTSGVWSGSPGSHSRARMGRQTARRTNGG